MLKQLWLVERVYGKNKEHVEISSEGVVKHVSNSLIKEIHPGNFVVLEGEIIIQVFPENKVK